MTRMFRVEYCAESQMARALNFKKYLPYNYFFMENVNVLDMYKWIWKVCPKRSR